MKVRSRNHGAARPLEGVERRLLNLLQGSFPLAPRPFAAVGDLAGVSEDEVLARTTQLLGDRIIRQLTPIYDTRALGYQSLLVAAKVDPEVPWRAAKAINSHPGVSHNYLRNHEFNVWFTVAVPEDSRLGMDGTLAVLPGAQRGGVDPPAADAEAVQDPDGPGDGGRHRPAHRRRCRGGQAGRDRQAAVRRLRPRGDPRDTGRPAGLPGALRAGCSRPRRQPGAPARAHGGHGRARAAAPRGRDPVPPPRRVLGERMGVWKVPSDRIAELGPRMAAFRGVSHCYERPTYEDWPYQIFTMAHGRSKQECDAILDAIEEGLGCIEQRATLYSSTEFKKVRLRYFTDDYAAWETTHV
jgi:siroheme decarboxylase